MYVIDMTYCTIAIAMAAGLSSKPGAMSCIFKFDNNLLEAKKKKMKSQQRKLQIYDCIFNALWM